MTEDVKTNMTTELLECVELAIIANGGGAHKKEMCGCDARMRPCEYCAIWDALNKIYNYLLDLKGKHSSGGEKTMDDIKQDNQDTKMVPTESPRAAGLRPKPNETPMNEPTKETLKPGSLDRMVSRLGRSERTRKITATRRIRTA